MKPFGGFGAGSAISQCRLALGRRASMLATFARRGRRANIEAVMTRRNWTQKFLFVLFTMGLVLIGSCGSDSIGEMMADAGRMLVDSGRLLLDGSEAADAADAASAQVSCTACTQTYEMLSDQTIAGDTLSVPIDTRGHESVVLYLFSSSCPSDGWEYSFSLGSDRAVFTGRERSLGGRILVDGPYLFLRPPLGCTRAHFQVAGISRR